MNRSSICEGLKVVELASVLAGPAVGMFFAELGAQVIKVENSKTGGDITRQWKLPVERRSDDKSSYYHAVNWKKEVVFADLSRADDHRHIMELIASADVLITNFKEGDEEKFNLQAWKLREMFPALIIGRISGFGIDSPRIAFDAVLQAESGLMSMNGEVGGPSLKMPVALIDVIAAHQMKEALLLALWKRAETGAGAIADVSLMTAAVVSLMNQSSAFLNTGYVPGKQGSLHPNIAPYGETFQCGDRREILLAVGSDLQFQKLAGIVNRPELAVDPRFITNTNRVENRKLLGAILADALLVKAAHEWLEILHREQVPAAAICTIDEVFGKPENKQLILEQTEADGTISRRSSTLAFTLT